MCGCSFGLLYRGHQSGEKKNQTSQLLVSFIKPHNAVAKSTVSDWVKQILIMAGINTDIFKPHSTCSASSSHARLSSLSLSGILKRRSWSNKTTWEKLLQQIYPDFWRKNLESRCQFGRPWREADGGLGSTFIFPWRWENTTFDRNRDFVK